VIKTVAHAFNPTGWFSVKKIRPVLTGIAY